MGGLALGLAACRRSDQPPVYPVTGAVFYQGKPAEVGLGYLGPIGRQRPEIAAARRPGAGEGRILSLDHYLSYDKAPAGRYAVTIVYPSAAKKEENDENIGPDVLQGRYANSNTTPLMVEVKEDINKFLAVQIK